jgi:tetratricopeptide (TPR) repeat protein
MLTLLILALFAQAPDLDKYLAAQNAFAANPKSEERIVALVSILYERDQNDRAIQLLEPFVKANPRATRAKLFLALGYAREEKYAQAKVLATQVATELPSDYYAQHILGLSLFGLNEFDAAESRFKKATTLKPDFADSYFQLGLLYSRNPATLQAALSSYERAVKIGYPHAEIYRDLGSVNIKLGKYDDAIRYLNKSLELNPNYADAYFQLADAFRKSGKADESAQATRKFQELNAAALDQKQRQTKGQALYDQGVSLLQKNDLAKAYDTFRSVAETLPQFDAAFYRMAQLEYLHDDNAQALAHVRHALELNPFEAEYYYVLSRCLEDSDLRSAIDAATKAVSLNGNVADFYGLLGDLYTQSSEYFRAVQNYRRAIQLDPKNQEFRKNLAAAERKLPPGSIKPR